jgi:hypothetical protein
VLAAWYTIPDAWHGETMIAVGVVATGLVLWVIGYAVYERLTGDGASQASRARPLDRGFTVDQAADVVALQRMGNRDVDVTVDPMADYG